MADQKLISHITPTISLLADNRQFVVVIKENPGQVINNGFHTYHQTIGGAFEEILSHMTRSQLADGRDKTMEEVAAVVKRTIDEVRSLFKPFEELTITKKTLL